MNARKVIQIIFRGGVTLFALCDDGTIWQARDSLRNPEWVQVAAPPETGNEGAR